MGFARLMGRWVVLALAVLTFLAGCGGGGGSAGTSLYPGGSGSPTPSDLQIKFNPASVDNSGTQSVTATITAVDASGQGVAGVPVSISVDKDATFSITSATGSTTGPDGTITANVTIGNNASLRSITLTASSGSISRHASFDVTGNLQSASDLILTVSSPFIANSVTNSVTVTATAVDANRNALAGIPVTLKVDNGATILPSALQTRSDGTVSGVLRIGSDQANRQLTVTATSGAVTRTTTVDVVGAKLTASNFANVIGTSTVASIVYLLADNTGAKMAGYPITITASGLPSPSCTPSPCRTDSSGQFTYRFTTPTAAGDVNISASAGGQTLVTTVTVTGTVIIPPANPAVVSASVAADPSVVAVNAGGATTNEVEIRALFVAANNAPVKNVRVWFDLNGDQNSIGGTLASTAARVLLYSDSNGVARTTYRPGSRYSPKDGVTVRVCWDENDFSIPFKDGDACIPVTQSFVRQALATLTVASESLSVSIGTNSLIGVGPSGLTYTKQYVVQVVDSAGQAKAGVQISPSIDLLSYYKGFWTVGATAWVQGGYGNIYPSLYPPGYVQMVPAEALAVKYNLFNTITVDWQLGNISVCDNEDLNRNGVAENFLDYYQLIVIPEDQNGSAALLPSRPALDPRKADVSITAPNGSTTNSSGIVVLQIEYPQNVASWVKFNILVSASGVAGTEGRAIYTGVLPVRAIEVTTVSASPPFQFSPYGTQGSESFLRKNAQGQFGWLCTNPN